LPISPHAMYIKDGKLIKAAPQSAEKFYAYNGAVYVLRSERLKQPGNPYGDNCLPLIMDPADSLDIDTDSDLELAKFLLKRKKS
ncbi:MAG: hypothetical protein PHN33_01235, partial [Candidatus Peribacteraceae bacterium]|nr:hypothetical protein [Candidatus Peribacteraceae bacterium]